MCNNYFMGRKYELKRRATTQARTRQRIVEAAVALHTTIGPVRTTVSGIAERAGVQRHTVYNHFPDEQSLGLACSGLFVEQYPLPDPTQWLRIADGEQRLRHSASEMQTFALPAVLASDSPFRLQPVTATTRLAAITDVFIHRMSIESP